jgi:polysaccharide deacetylase family protein (PEP-CTERM system associated)
MDSGVDMQYSVKTQPVSAIATQNAFSIDIEEHFHVSAFDRVIDRTDWDAQQSRVVSNTDRLLDILAEFNVNGTFFVLGWVAERHPDLIRRIASANHEIGCHGFSHKKVYEQSPKVFRGETRRARQAIEDITGRSPTGYRAASFSITKRSLWALDILLEEGFSYDSSIFPVVHDNYGYSGAAPEPGVICTPEGNHIYELPMSTISILGVRMPIGGGGYFRLYPYVVTKALLQAKNRQQKPFIFYCHPWEIDTDQPRVEQASRLSKFRHYNNLHKFEYRLRMLLEQFSFTTCDQLVGSLERTRLAA